MRFPGVRSAEVTSRPPASARFKTDVSSVLPSILPSKSNAGNDRSAVRTGNKIATPFSPYPWLHRQTKTRGLLSSDDKQFYGSFVNTLAMDLDLEDLAPQPLHLAPKVEYLRGHEPCCYLFGENLIVCKGIVIVSCPPDQSLRRGWGMLIASLPAHLCPNEPLMFAGMLRSLRDRDGCDFGQVQLVSLIVRPDGWITCVGCKEAQGVIDLSSIRFCIGPGFSIQEAMQLFLCEMSGRRYVVLQNALYSRHFDIDGGKQLVSLPKGCIPIQPLWFIVAGDRSFNFHLLRIQQPTQHAPTVDVFWCDCMWTCDSIHLTGIMYEAAPAAVIHPVMQTNWNVDISIMFLKSFHDLLRQKYVTLEEAWKIGDGDGTGGLNFEEFRFICKCAGYLGNPMRLWVLLDADGSGEISFEEFSGNPEGFGK